jgi:hypothetical protein
LSSKALYQTNQILFRKNQMKTFNQILTQRLQQNGMFENQAVEVMKLYWASDLACTSAGLADKPVNGYSEQIENLIWAGVRIIALKYINENCPKAWFKAVFDDSDPIHEQVANSKKQSF